jgi:predicted  nucleic acid-binding Zn-ribbon protein
VRKRGNGDEIMKLSSDDITAAIGIMFLWVLFGLPYVIGFIGFGLNVLPHLPTEELGPFSRELWQLILLGAGISWILTLPTIIIHLSVESKLSSHILIFVIFLVVASWITAIIGNIGSSGKFEVNWLMALLLGLSYLLYIPHFLTLYMASLLLYYKFKLPIIEYKIRVLREKIGEYKAILDQRSKIEQNIRSIVAFDPGNLSIKARNLQEKAQRMTYDEIKARRIEIDLELSRIEGLRGEAERKLRAVEDEKRALELRVSDINSRLHVFERIDPANFQIKMQKLKQLEGIGRGELKKIKPTGELEELFFEKISLGYQINDVYEEIKDIVKEISRMEMEKLSLQLENLTLDLEEVNRTIRSMEPRLLEMKDSLKRLEDERNRILRRSP